MRSISLAQWKIDDRSVRAFGLTSQRETRLILARCKVQHTEIDRVLFVGNVMLSEIQFHVHNAFIEASAAVYSSFSLSYNAVIERNIMTREKCN